jgi:cytochrome c556
MRFASFVLVAVAVTGCGSPGNQTATTPSENQAAPAATTLTQQPHANLAQMMRAIPFPASNIIFDTQSNDPGAAKPAEKGSTSTATTAYANVYTGWQQVEQSALALSETANLLMIPGRLCQNGKPVPLDREDFRKAVKGLADAGMAAYKAAQSKSQEAMVEVSGTVADACAACHEIYRDKPEGQDRCVP